ncbi:putative GABA permease [Podospora didyma]|uniref:GABA permease n=1 Tax=Podospora didyma TaxID=330526 RepID=A0AAE0U3K9_9PEZI|nr:putative GABA permease [Podospora didyma]
MEDVKLKHETHDATSLEIAEADIDDAVGKTEGLSRLDKKDMFRMGKKQQLRRNFHFFSIFGFIMVLMQTWEAQVNVIIFGLVNGGTGGLIWMYLGTFFGFTCVVVSMAEMASMAPTTGGQYHWVSEFAPASSQRFLSYLVGWLSVLGWQVGNVAIGFLVAQQIQGVVLLNHESYVPERWHLTLIVIAVETFCQVLNTTFYRQLPLLETLALLLHVAGFLIILIPLWVLGPRAEDPSAVFFTFTDGGGWGNTGLSCLIGILTPIFSLLGPDSATHMSEELRNASKSLPRAMIATMIANGVMGFVMLVTVCMVLGDIQAVLATPTGQPFVHVFYNVVQSKSGASAMASILIIMSLVGNTNNIATSSRQLWAFARDKGVPYSDWLSAVHPRLDLPVNALIFSYVMAVLLSLINIGSTIAFNILTSLGVGALLSSYIISVSCIALKRLRNEPLLPASFRLGRLGLPLNIFSALFLIFVFVLTFFPPVPSPTPELMNWSILVWGFVVIFSMGYYYLGRGRHTYTGPVAYVRKSA